MSDSRHKALTELLGKPIIEHTIEELRETGVDEVIVVQGPEKNIEEELGGVADRYVVQDEPEGMGNALRQAEPFLDGKFLVLTPYRANASSFFQPMIEKAEEENADTVFVSTPTDTPEKYGVLDLEDGKAVDMVEKPDTEKAPSDQKVVGMYLLDESFFDYMDEVKTWEYQFEDALSLQMREKPASVLKIEEETNSIKYPWDLFSAKDELLERRQRHVSEEADVAESAKLDGKVIVDDDVKIYENAVIRGPAYIGEGAVVGNNALVRESSIEENTTIGANAEVKNSIFQPESSMHSGFFGDSIVGRATSIGAGTVTANKLFRRKGERRTVESSPVAKDYVKDTGRESFGVVIGENVDIGVNVSLMPGIQVGSDSTIGPGTVVEENVESGVTVYVRQEQERK